MNDAVDDDCTSVDEGWAGREKRETGDTRTVIDRTVIDTNRHRHDPSTTEPGRVLTWKKNLVLLLRHHPPRCSESLFDCDLPPFRLSSPPLSGPARRELLTLRDAEGTLVEAVEYDDGGAWPREPDGGVASQSWPFNSTDL